MFNLRAVRVVNRSDANTIGKTSDCHPRGSGFNPRPGRVVNRSECDAGAIGKTPDCYPRGSGFNPRPGRGLIRK